jgi:predicted transcriptional regulator
MSADETPDGFNLPDLISEVHAALIGLQSGPTMEAAATVEPQRPAVSIKKSITPDYLISLEDGKQYKALKRHLAKLAMSPVEYRSKWGLPIDYPMVAPNYALQRSELAKRSGLGRRAATEVLAPEPEPEPAELEPAPAPARKKRGRKPIASKSTT